VDAALLWFLIASDRCNPVRALTEIMTVHRIEPALFWARQLCAHPGEARQRLTKGDLERLGLIDLKLSREGLMQVEPSWRLGNLLNRAMGGADEDLIEMLVGRRQRAMLSLDRFGRVTEDAALIARLIQGALENKAAGINILLYGPPGTGKTELARSVSDAAGGQLFSVGEADEYDEEPNRWDRVSAFRMAQRVAERREKTVLLFDEMEDLIGDAQPGAGDSFRGREGSKIYINRLLETNAAPTIWTTNALGNIDPAILRRMSFVLKLDHASPAAAQAMLEHIAAEEGVEIGNAGLRLLTTHAPDSASVLRNALRAGQIAGGGEADAMLAATTLLSAVRGGEKLRLPKRDPGAIDLALYEADRDISKLVATLTAPGAPADFSLLLTGPPGTGKTALAHHLAHQLDRPLIVKRASDLLSKWVGGTERLIADAFEEAVNRDGVLLFDEVDSLLLDRSTARVSWEVTQVNELLTQFDDHPLPFIAATNHARKLDPAALRRFVFKLDFFPMSRAKMAEAYVRFFGNKAPAGLVELEGLTPGDFAVVARQLRYARQPVASGEIIERLSAERAAKPGVSGRIGF
jgi:transitional endoplasmic reticulum ATPase